MEAIWFVPVVALLAVGIYFLVRAFIKLQRSVIEVRKGLADLNEMGPRLQRLGKDVSHLAETIEEKRRQ